MNEMEKLTLEAARESAESALASMRGEIELAFGGDPFESDWAWVFPWNSRAYCETGDFASMLIGAGPIVVPRDGGEIWVMGSAAAPEVQLDAWEAEHDAPGSLGRAIRIAHEAHAGQVDKSGADYIGHPLRVMRAVETIDAKKVAVLHDVVEDTPVTIEQLRAEGFSEEILAAVDAVTKRKGETLAESMERVVGIPLARTVKLADVADNSNPNRLAVLPIVDRERLQKKYAETLELLGA
jgi:hypothetical protein